jgi:hypothetical protein
VPLRPVLIAAVAAFFRRLGADDPSSACEEKCRPRCVGKSTLAIVGSLRDVKTKKRSGALLLGLVLTAAGFAVALLAIGLVLVVAPAFLPPHAPTTPP